jgi:uncharacterized membrane protein
MTQLIGQTAVEWLDVGILLGEMGPWGLALLSRFAHVIGAILFLGTAFYVGCVLQPALRSLSSDEAEKVRSATRRPWALLVMAAMFLLLVSGFYNYFRIISLDREGVYELPKLYHPLIGVKIILALALFFLVSLLAGRSPAAVRMQAKTPFWINIVLLLGVILIAIASVLKMLDKTTLPAAELIAAQAFADADSV